jgi:hypothetical protein
MEDSGPDRGDILAPPSTAPHFACFAADDLAMADSAIER